MARPASTPGWSAAGVEPSAGEKAAGWSFRMKPPAAWFNWFWTLLSDWITYLDGKTNGTFSVRISPRIRQDFAAVLAPADIWNGWAVTTNQVRFNGSFGVETNGGAGIHVIQRWGINDALFNRIISADDKVQLVSVDLDVNIPAGSVKIDVIEETDVGGGAFAVLMTETDAVATVGYENRVFDGGAGPYDLDPTKTYNIQVTMTQVAANIIQVDSVTLECQVVPV